MWPPAETRRAAVRYAEWGAWYSGDHDELAAVNAAALGTGVVDGMSATERPGRGSVLMGAIRRRFWGVPPPGGQLKAAKLHIPLPADIAATSSGLLYGVPPKLIATGEGGGGKATQARVDDYMFDSGLSSVLLEAGEFASAYGGTYLRVGWDKEVADMPVFDAITPEHAVPEFRAGWLYAVTFWRNVGELGGKRLRHLERHERGRIIHALYAGTSEKLGRRVDLGESPATEEYARLVNAEGWVETGSKGLTVEYFPNLRPSRCQHGPWLGRSDFDGVEPLFDGLDEVWTSWIRDVRIGKGRIVVPSGYMQNRGRGRGALFDPEQEVYEQVEALGNAAGLAMEVVQFEIRHAEHAATAQELTDKALRAAGYSPQTFGSAGDVAITATEVAAKQGHTMQTRDRKISYARPRLRRFLGVALDVDLKHFGPDKVRAIPPVVEFPDAVAPDPEAAARSLQMQRAAEVISIRTGVKRVNPDWEDPQVDEEVKRIYADRGDTAAVGNPGDGTGNTAAGLDPDTAGGSDGPAGGVPADPTKPVNGAPVPPRSARPTVPAAR